MTLPDYRGVIIDKPDPYEDDAPRKGWRDRTIGEREAFNEGRSCTVFWCLLTAIVCGPAGWFLHKVVA